MGILSPCVDGHKYYSGDQIKESEMEGNVARMGERRGAYKVLVGKTEGKRILEKHKRS